MGIPSYFSLIIKEYPTIIKKILQQTQCTDHFFLDANSIVYDCARSIDFQAHNKDPNTLVIEHVISKLEEYIRIVKPKKTIMISLDGTPPVAKLEQQRQRRYKSWYTASLSKHKPTNDTVVYFDTINITTGTPFMKQLNHALVEHFNNPKHYNVERVIVSTSEIPGEGESKIFEYLRSSNKIKRKDTCLVYGLDADLIMLGLNNLQHCNNICLFRETPEFIKSIDSSLEPNENYMLDLPELSLKINAYLSMQDLSINRVQDYIFICFILGNDFLPHFPSLNIRTHGIDRLLNAYRGTVGSTKETIIQNNTICWKNFRNMLLVIVEREEEYIMNELKLREKYTYQQFSDDTPEEELRKINALPTRNREGEQFISPPTKNWKNNYYDILFHIEINDIRRKEIATNYLEGLEWTFKYYTHSCPDWRWCYKYNYPPLLCDLIKYVPYFQTNYIQNGNLEPINSVVQLCYVLPRNKLNILPVELCTKLIETFPHWYENDVKFSWAFCKYLWEAHAELPHINIQELTMFVTKNRNLLTTVNI